MDTRPLLLIVDMSALAFRSHYAFIHRPLSRADGMETSALFGTCNSLLNVLESYRPSHVLCALDTGEKNFRHAMYPDYKAHRPDCPPALALQLGMLEELTEAFSLKSVKQSGFEADDIIASYARLGKKEGLEVLIYSGDKDFMQLVDEKTKMLISHKGGDGEILDVDGVKAKLGIEPKQVGDYLALLGDASDNVPGAPGVGKVTASKLLNEFGDLKNLLNSASSLKQKGLSAKLMDHREQIELSRRLVDLCYELPEMLSLEELHFDGFKRDAFEPFVSKMEFPRILARASAWQPQRGSEREAVKLNVEGPLPQDAWSTVLSAPMKVSVWFEERESELLVAWSVEEGEARWMCLDRDQRRWFLTEALPKIYLVSAQSKNWMRMAMEHGGAIPQGDDLLLMASVLHQGGRDQTIEQLCEHQLHLELVDMGKKGSRRRQIEDLDAQELGIFMGQRAEIGLSLHQTLKKGLEEAELMEVYEDLEKPLLKVIAEVETRGVRMNPEPLRTQSAEVMEEIKALSDSIYEMSGEEFNISSPQQLANILFDKMRLQDELGLKRLKKTKTGYSTDSSVLESMKGHPIAEALLRYRFLTKINSTYLEALPKAIDKRTGRIHTTYHQNGTSTGRLSSQYPNLQNIPMREPEGAKIREAFIPCDDNHVIIAADYSQIELRVLAHYSGDPVMAEAFREHRDIHATTAAKVFSITEAEVTRQQRSSAKAVNFGLLYGMGPKLLSQQTGLSFAEAQRFIKAYFETFPSIREFMTQQVEVARNQGYALTLGGRRRYLPDLNSDNGMRKNAAENMALNTPIQGSAADIIKWAMLGLHKRIEEENLPMQMIMQVHDELVLECHQSAQDACSKIICEEMESPRALPVDFRIPLVVELGHGRHWLEAHG